MGAVPITSTMNTCPVQGRRRPLLVHGWLDILGYIGVAHRQVFMMGVK